ncbi:oxidoreductase [Aurantiacibacter sediminis]|uniref:SDR family NAD(P)-dependent oxidoreductase n=1 Tax=Aurantiacibacter sediminis TaxID=2793064 RepID=A0ABS0N5J3_9SPHN|nr:oxidoreductase [Aurantiacibacter sediminis]MBH5323045.1 SDR family NAD(P)-dependent oxidoreductase [Aurantiacibacter sediminis]
MADFTFTDIPKQSPKTAIVTGANTGIGFEIARHLARVGAKVLLACRNEEKAQDAIDRIGAEYPMAKLDFLPLDLNDLDSIHAAAEQAKAEKRIDILVNNAGIMVPPLDHGIGGVESQFAVNHLGHFALTALLFEKLEEKGGRVVVQSSIAHKKGQIDIYNLDAYRGYEPWRFYQQSKLANLMFALELDRRLRAANSRVAAIACHPGVAASDLARHMKYGSAMQPVMKTVLNTSEQGALPALQAATDPAAESGDYYGPRGLMEARGNSSGRAFIAYQAREEQVAKRLWDKSEELTGVTFSV